MRRQKKGKEPIERIAKKAMINYTIDVSAFAIPEDRFLSAADAERKIMVSNVIKAVDYYKTLKRSGDAAVFFPMFSLDETYKLLKRNNAMRIHKEYIKSINEQYLSYNEYIIFLNEITEKFNTDVYDKGIKGWYESFNNQFDFQYIVLQNMAFAGTPQPSVPEFMDENFKKTIAATGIMNRQFYGRGDCHFVVTGLFEGRDEVDFNAEIKAMGWGADFWEVKKVIGINTIKKINGTVRRKFSENTKRYKRKYRTLQEAVDEAQNDFQSNLYFEKKVDESINTVGPEAGPPDRIYHYLQTLDCTTGHLKTLIQAAKINVPDYLLEFIGRMYGLNYAKEESWGTQKCKKAMNERKLNDNDPGDVFLAHLRPSRLRIYFKWDAGIGKIRVGWIGKHLSTISEPGKPDACCKNCGIIYCRNNPRASVLLI
jgi:hypothetical protein